jgi:4-diphosphocytidyl-2-C-methyl-D-erythritol kinase
VIATERAPAKLNLGLRVVGRRADGFHLLASVFVPLDLCDELEVTVGPGAGVTLRIEGGPPDLPADDDNLAVRAATAFLEAAGTDRAVALRLTKRIPVGAGLGGGSSDAAAVLRALMRSLPGAVGPVRMASLAIALGADVPYFLDPRPARVGGIGERIEPLAGVPSYAVLVATPAPGLPTREVFAAYDADPAPVPAALTPGEGPLTMPAPPALLDRPAPLEALQSFLVNDLEPVATRLRPAIRRVRNEIEAAGARAVGMSGSGPTVFGLFDDADRARMAAARIRWEPSDRVHVGRTGGSP